MKSWVSPMGPGVCGGEGERGQVGQNAGLGPHVEVVFQSVCWKAVDDAPKPNVFARRQLYLLVNDTHVLMEETLTSQLLSHEPNWMGVCSS